MSGNIADGDFERDCLLSEDSSDTYEQNPQDSDNIIYRQPMLKKLSININ